MKKKTPYKEFKPTASLIFQVLDSTIYENEHRVDLKAINMSEHGLYTEFDTHSNLCPNPGDAGENPEH